MKTLADFTAEDLQDHTVALGSKLGQVLLVVNVASRCGFTPQYAELEALYRQYHAQGFSVLGFPCNQFGAQEPGDHGQIRTFCDSHYGVTFPMFGKVDVNGQQAHPFYAWLKQSAPGILGSTSIKWNFTKFLIGRDGQVIRRYAPNTKPMKLQVDIERALAQPVSSELTSA